METVADKVPPPVLAFLRTMATNVGRGLLVNLIVEVISKAQEIISDF